MRVALLRAVVIGAICASSANAQTLPLPQNLINLNSSQGSALLHDSEALQSYWPLSIQFVAQKNQAFWRGRQYWHGAQCAAYPSANHTGV